MATGSQANEQKKKTTTHRHKTLSPVPLLYTVPSNQPLELSVILNLIPRCVNIRPWLPCPVPGYGFYLFIYLISNLYTPFAGRSRRAV